MTTSISPARTEDLRKNPGGVATPAKAPLRVWLLEPETGLQGPSLEERLQQLPQGTPPELCYLGRLRISTETVADLRARAAESLVVVAAEGIGEAEQEALLTTGVSLLVCASSAHGRLWSALLSRFPLLLLPRQVSTEALVMAIHSLQGWRERELELRTQVQQLQQRLQDRIIIERAKGVMIQHLGITEEAAYNRLRLQSRKQRRPIREIAQSLLDSQGLLLPEGMTLPAGGASTRSQPRSE